jgi:uncharacterized protein (UPF0276 family)
LKSSLQLTGIGLRTSHYAEFLEKRPSVAWVEVHSENYFGEGGKPLSILEQIRRDYPVSLHGVSLSIGSADDLNWGHLKKLRDLTDRIQPCLVSDHLSWSSINGQYLHDLLPLPYTDEGVQHIVSRIQQIQDYLGRQILIENISSYISFPHSTLTEQQFLSDIARQSGCGILLDINNIYVTASNLGFDPEQYLNAIPGHLVQEMHLAGFTTSEINGKNVLIDSHNQPITNAVWNLYRKAVERLGLKPTIIEWDSDIPPLEALHLEAYRAEIIMRETYAATKRTG